MDDMDNVTISEEPDAHNDRTAEPGALASATERRPVLKQVPISLIVAVRNPRHTSHPARSTLIKYGNAADALLLQNPELSGTDVADPDLKGLARSLGSEGDPRLAEPPIVEEMPDGHYRLCAGERRVEAAQLANWVSILCLVHPPMDPVRAHTLGLVENLHRLPMHPLEEISALCISRLLANADARGVGVQARRLLEDAWGRQDSSYNILGGLEQILRDSGWAPERPDVSWKTHLDDLGISMAPWERKRKLRLLNIEPALQERLRELDITEAALRALGTLEPGDQERVVEALMANPALARKVRRVARARRDGFYTSIEDALAEVQGLQRTASASLDAPDFIEPAPASATPEAPAAPATVTVSSDIGQRESPSPPAVSEPAHFHVEDQVPSAIQDAVLQLLECADRLSSAISALRPYKGGSTLAEPWGTWSSDALAFISQQLTNHNEIETQS